MQIGIKLLDNNAKTPTRANEFDAGFDLYSSEDRLIKPKTREVIRTSIALEIPNGLAGLIWPRSGLSVKQGIDVLAGVIDSGYRGEIMVCLLNTSDYSVNISNGDRVAQILFQVVPDIQLSVRQSLSVSERGEKGFGSSGK
jgi:dUTP pyrophosphatase